MTNDLYMGLHALFVCVASLYLKFLIVEKDEWRKSV
jgi:hypothetical protein